MFDPGSRPLGVGCFPGDQGDFSISSLRFLSCGSTIALVRASSLEDSDKNSLTGPTFLLHRSDPAVGRVFCPSAGSRHQHAVVMGHWCVISLPNGPIYYSDITGPELTCRAHHPAWSSGGSFGASSLCPPFPSRVFPRVLHRLASDVSCSPDLARRDPHVMHVLPRSPVSGLGSSQTPYLQVSSIRGPDPHQPC